MLGVLAVRLQLLNKILEWNGANMQFANIEDDEKIKFVISDGFIIKDGHPSFNLMPKCRHQLTHIAAKYSKSVKNGGKNIKIRNKTPSSHF
jgi:hypothetical protein